MDTRVSIPEAVRRITAAPAPLLILDTCALLDLIRIPIRSKSPESATRELESARAVLGNCQESPSNSWVIIPPLVTQEWHNNFENTIGEVRQHWARLDRDIRVAHMTAKAVDLSLPGLFEYSLQNIETTLANLSGEFFRHGLSIEDDSDCQHRAYLRTISNLAPARKGGGLKDCSIIEHSIELCARLRDAGFPPKCVFLTSNTKDFCESVTTPKEPLGEDLAAVSLVLTTNWQWANFELGT